MKKVKCFLSVLMLSSVMLLGCGDSAEKVESDSDQCVVVQVPDGSTVEELFTFKQKTQRLYCMGSKRCFSVCSGRGRRQRYPSL